MPCEYCGFLTLNHVVVMPSSWYLKGATILLPIPGMTWTEEPVERLRVEGAGA